ncbi:MAG: hypothetical protein H6595_10835 [Flavobacteriales bacterium]|nr:hypothetical protein [Flavobacteriales bacterium]
MKHFFALGALLATALPAAAQPPFSVDWYHDQVYWYQAWYKDRVEIKNTNGATSMIIHDDLNNPYVCVGAPSPVRASFSAGGFPAGLGCIDFLWSDTYVTTLYPQNISIYDVFQGSDFDIYVTNVYQSLYNEPYTLNCGGGIAYEYASDGHAFLAEQGTLYVAANSDVCPDLRLFKQPYPTTLSQCDWCTCIPSNVRSLELHYDTLLAIGFPTVTKVDVATGTQGGSFDLYSGANASDGYTFMDGDTLFWTSRYDGNGIHVGRYQYGVGPVWEVTVPIFAPPLELLGDPYGRLWTAADDQLIWIDRANGTFSTYAFPGTIEDIDMLGDQLAFTGTTDGVTNYVLKAHVVP